MLLSQQPVCRIRPSNQDLLNHMETKREDEETHFESTVVTDVLMENKEEEIVEYLSSDEFILNLMTGYSTLDEEMIRRMSYAVTKENEKILLRNIDKIKSSKSPSKTSLGLYLSAALCLCKSLYQVCIY